MSTRMTAAQRDRLENHRIASVALRNFQLNRKSYEPHQVDGFNSCVTKVVEEMLNCIMLGQKPCMDATWGDTEIMLYTILRDAFRKFKPKDLQMMLDY